MKRTQVEASFVSVGGQRVLARFPSGGTAPESCEIERSRARRYPGLISTAPRTDAFYRAFAGYTFGKKVLDVGCGAGAHLVHLEGAREIVGVDIDDDAVWFAKNALPGGNALAFDWQLLAGTRWPKPWLLAGGLHADNLAEAVRTSGARGVDVSSGVEDAPGRKSPAKIAAFLAAAKAL